MESQRTRKTSRRDLLLFFVMAALLMVASFLVENRAFFDIKTPQRVLSDAEVFVSYGAYFLLLVIFLVLAFREGQARTHWGFLVFFFLLFVSDAIAIWFFPGIYDTGELIYSLTWVSQIRYTLFGAMLFSALYSAFGLMPQLTQGSKIFDLLYFGTVLLVLASVAYSYIVERDLYVAIYNAGGPENAYSTPVSWTSHKNIYAFMLFYGMAAEACLEFRKPHWWRWFLIAFFYANQFLLLSKTVLGMSTFFIVAVYLAYFFRTLKRHPVRNGVVLGLLVLGLVGGVFMVYFGLTDKTKLTSYMANVFDLMVGSIQATMADRVYIWSDVIRSISSFPLTMVVGFGSANWTPSVYSYINGSPTSYVPLDSAWVVALARDGLVGCGAAIILWVYVLVKIIRGIKARRPGALINLFFLIALLMRSFVEAGDFSYLDAAGLMAIVSVYLPSASESFYQRHPEIAEAEQKAYLTPLLSRVKSTYSAAHYLRRSYLLLAPILAALTGVLIPLSSLTHHEFLASSNLFISLSIATLVLPLLLATCALMRRRHAFFSYLNLLFWTLVYGVLSVALPYFADTWLGFAFPLIFALLLLIAVLCTSYLPAPKELVSILAPFLVLSLCVFFGWRHLYPYLGAASEYLVVALFLLAITLFYCLIALFPSLSPFEGFADRFDERYRHFLARYNVKRDLAYARVYAPKEGGAQ